MLTVAHNRRLCTHQRQDLRRPKPAGDANDNRQRGTDPDCLFSYGPRGIRIVFADPARHQCGDSHAESDGNRVQQGQNGFGEADSRHGIGAQSSDEKYVDNDENGFHAHFQNHRNREQQHGTAHGTCRVVTLFACQRIANDGARTAPCRNNATGTT